MTPSNHVRSERGQVLVIVAAGMIALIAMVGLVIDGGHAWGRQRETQNVADSIAKAGNVPILEFLGGDSSVTTGDVGCAVDAAEAVTGVAVENAEFTDFEGDPIGISVPECGTSGTFSDEMQGVKVTATLDFDTFLMQVVGFDQLTARANATAVVGPIVGLGIVLPVTFPHSPSIASATGMRQTSRRDPPTLRTSGTRMRSCLPRWSSTRQP
jgi:uncharacterized membrane protein